MALPYYKYQYDYLANAGTTMRRDLIYIPLAFCLFTHLYDHSISYYLMNYRRVSSEANPLFRAEDGSLNVAASLLKLFIVFLIQVGVLYALDLKASKPLARNFKKLDIHKTYRLYGNLFELTIVINCAVFAVGVVWNTSCFPIEENACQNWLLIDTLSSYLEPAYLNHIVPLFGLPLAYYWYYSYWWRYLCPEARQRRRYRWLQWPYRIGFMKDEIV